MIAGMSTGENVHDCVEESSAVNSTFSLEELSTLQQSCRTFSMRDDDSSKRVDAQDLSGADEVVAVFQSFCIDKSSLVRDQEAKDTTKVDYSAESSALRNDEREDTLNANFPLDSSPIGDEIKGITRVDDNSNTCPDITCPSPCRRSSCRNRLDQENKKKGPARDCRKTSSKNAFLDVSSLQLTRRRRSSLSKQARATVWGLLGNISVLEQNGAVDISPQKAKKSRRLNGVGANVKREKNKKVRDSTKLKGKRFTPTGPITLKVKFGGREAASLVNVSTVMDDNKEQDSRQESFPEASLGVKDLMKREADGSMSFQSCDGNLDKASDIHLATEDITENADGNTYGDLCESPFQAEIDKVVVTIDNRISDSGTSPDSEVINLTPDAQITEKDPEALHHTLSSINAYLASENMSNLGLLCKDADEGKRDNEHNQTSNFSVNVKEILVDGQEFSKLGQKEKVGDVFYHSDASTSTTSENAYLNTFEVEGLPREPPPCSKVTDFAISSETNKVESAIEANLSPRLGPEVGPVESSMSKKLLPCTNGQKVARSSRARKETRTKREKTSKKKGNQEKSSAKQNGKDKGLNGDSAQILNEVENHCETEAGETGNGNKSLTEETPPSKDMAPVMVAQESTPITQAWVCCDGCSKWRRIPAALADLIRETNRQWFCKDNMDKDFADCSIPQEKSNADINAELQISDASCEEDAASDAQLDSVKSTQKQRKVTQQPSWTHIKSNSFLHRRRKTQAIDEIMVCHCKPPSEGRVGCGDGCLNRMLNIECTQGTCPSGEFCSNQQFQKRKYAKLKAIKCGKKGYGLQLLEDVSEGQFLIEYVGEALDMHAYEARQREYAVKGHRHFYFMTLNGSEVIDACAKGNLGRFINHSCEPNCRTEKWIVNGEVCIGIFALRDIKKGEEVTFDYNYVRVFGAAAKKCVCGSSHCRGYIGGDPLNAEIVVQDDSDDEYPEPIMVRGDGIALTSSHAEKEKQIREMSNQAKIDINCSSAAAGCLENTKESGDIKLSASTALSIAISLEKESSVGQHSPVQLVGTSSESGGITSENISAAPEECFARETSMGNPLCSNQGSDANSFLASGKIDPVKKVKNNVGEAGVVLSKSRARIKTSKSLSSVKKRKPKTEALDTKKPIELETKVHLPPFRSKQLLEDLSSGRFDAVQEKLNELLDNDGGISKRKDASRGYLKLLLLTAASGDSGNGEAIQSNRDLSMILDALLKTKSRTVLVDIINKNGLQMLHNIMKRYRKQFIKIPILRKLLKVLEYLATREILTFEHINGGPRYPGVESFRDSILSLTEHTDKQVHQIARSFRDRWIPRSSRKFGCIHRDDCRIELHRCSPRDTISASHANSNDCAGVPLETFDGAAKPELASSSVDARVPDVSSGSRSTRKRKSRWDQPFKGSPDLGADTSMAGDGANNMEEDVPPGFSFPLNRPMLPSDAYLNDMDHKEGKTSYAKRPYGVAVGHSQPRFNSRSSVAYGIPISIVQQFGTCEAETSENWIVAPGMPFQPFPPLPPYPRDKNKHSTMSRAGQKAGQDSHNRATHSSQNPPSTSGATGTGMQTETQMDFRRVRGPHNLSRTYFRQEKWNSSTAGGSQIQKRNVSGPMGNNSRNGTCQASPRSIHSEFNSSHCSTSMQSGVKFHQHPW